MSSTFCLFVCFCIFFFSVCGRRGGLMVSALDSGSGGPGCSPDRGTVLCSLEIHLSPVVPFSNQVQNGFRRNNAVVNPAMD